mmetsp:Transcript_2760/g.5773  ORF Transcript_2760/g.5773 Transcript_2760/m.5773 type:complete len:98 (+) Transcript_2760:428-721(+)|eukprot:CAMPEP_0197264172 /NCGR_PEP_ID=MMETSP1432-20130617/1638_1 /TAXON_ID=44447 /ORGANISM="Pseudo-nitzschia delicatissima, Strain UNC1205" /LENGTH=97 /DNA_ID=CAMNT_0042728793 /DNA_START=170 /DNA_END=463 /DNA_ORIENTATION=-
MNKFVASLLFAIVALHSSASAFTTQSRAKIATHKVVADMPSYQQTSTSLNLKVKVDPNAKTKNASGNAKAAAYGGSIAIAALLPIGFLIWSTLSKTS